MARPLNDVQRLIPLGLPCSDHGAMQLSSGSCEMLAPRLLELLRVRDSQRSL